MQQVPYALSTQPFSTTVQCGPTMCIIQLECMVTETYSGGGLDSIHSNPRDPLVIVGAAAGVLESFIEIPS